MAQKLSDTQAFLHRYSGKPVHLQSKKMNRPPGGTICATAKDIIAKWIMNK